MKRRYYELDALRGLSIIGVLLIHISASYFGKQDATFKIYQSDEETFEIDENGERVEVEEEAVEEDTAETV